MGFVERMRENRGTKETRGLGRPCTIFLIRVAVKRRAGIQVREVAKEEEFVEWRNRRSVKSS